MTDNASAQERQRRRAHLSVVPPSDQPQPEPQPSRQELAVLTLNETLDRFSETTNALADAADKFVVEVLAQLSRFRDRDPPGAA
jgi:hypothetical protein